MTRCVLQQSGDEFVTLWYAFGASGTDLHLVNEFRSSSSQVRVSRISRSAVDRFVIRGRLPLGPLLNTGRADVAWSPDFTLPPVNARRKAVTVHDLAWIAAPEYAPSGLRSFLDAAVPRQIRSADRIFTVSESIRNELLERFPVQEDVVVVASNGVDHRFAEAGSVADRAALEPLALPAEYMLMVGTLEPRKNHLRVFEAIEAVPGLPPLVVAGGRGWSDSEILQTMHGLSPRVVALGFVPENLLPQLYANATALIAPSVYEGFDLPVLEAIAAGIRVIASDIPVHREVAGDLARYFDPLSVESIRDGIIGGIGESNRSSLHPARRVETLARYDWSRSAARIWSTSREIA